MTACVVPMALATCSWVIPARLRASIRAEARASSPQRLVSCGEALTGPLVEPARLDGREAGVAP
jgi:hypothetical protein